MNARLRNVTLLGFVLLAGCAARLPRSLRTEARNESEKLQQADRQLQQAEKTVRDDLAQAPDLFQGTSVVNDWPARLRAARSKLDDARNNDRELARLVRDDRAESRSRVEWLLDGERQMRESALRDSDAVVAAAGKWLSFRRNLAPSVENMKREYDAIHAVDLTPTAKEVDKAEQDWPGKKAALESRLAMLRAEPETADKAWQSTAAARQDALAGKAKGPQIATLIQADDVLSQTATGLAKEAADLRAQCGQLYVAWDKILTDLDVSRSGPETQYREKIKTVRTRFVDVAAKKTETSTDENWTSVNEPQFRSVENDLGMAIGHKDAGLFDSEATTVPQPAGFAYMAPPSQGSNQYGYWSNQGGHSVWTWLPAYLIMRDALWGRGYKPVVIGDYNGYRTAQQTGHTYYGQATPTAPPKYGTRGTFTTQRYASSRYISSGAFKSSKYSSHPEATAARQPWWRSEPRVGSSDTGGRRFGASGSSSSGRRFGVGRSPSSGRRFGGGGFRSPGRSFGRRR